MVEADAETSLNVKSITTIFTFLLVLEKHQMCRVEGNWFMFELLLCSMGRRTVFHPSSSIPDWVCL